MAKQEKWWKILPFALITFGILGTLVSLVPYFSVPFLIASLVMALIAAIGSSLQRIPGYERVKILTVQAGLLIFFLLGVRIWLHFLPNTGALIIPSVIAYILAWLIPYLNPGISQILWREQFNPETRAGKTILRIGLIVLPIAGSSGAFIALYGDRYKLFGDLGRLMGPVVILAVIASAQAASHQIRKEQIALKETRLEHA